MQWPNDNITAAFLALIGTIIAASIAAASQRYLRRTDAVAINFVRQIRAWETLVKQLQATIAELQQELRIAEAKCEQRIAELRNEINRRDEVYRLIIAELKTRLA